MGYFAESLEKEGAGPVGGPIRRLWKNLGKRCCDPAQMVSGERKRDGVSDMIWRWGPVGLW